MNKSNAPSLTNLRELHPDTDHEKVVFWSDPDSAYRGIIAIHSTALGPALGGTRFWNYASEDEAVNDALRLSRGMSYKNAMAGLPFGGGKSVIIGDNRTLNRERLFRAHGRFVETFHGSYITAEDVGTSPEDMEYIRSETAHVGGLLSRSATLRRLRRAEFFVRFKRLPNIGGVQTIWPDARLRSRDAAKLVITLPENFSKPAPAW